VEARRNLDAQVPGLVTPGPHRFLRGRHELLTRQVLLPGLAALTGVILVAGPFAATIVRSALTEQGDAVSLQNFVALFSDSRFRRCRRPYPHHGECRVGDEFRH
jgi:hypothetical protein